MLLYVFISFFITIRRLFLRVAEGVDPYHVIDYFKALPAKDAGVSEGEKTSAFEIVSPPQIR